MDLAKAAATMIRLLGLLLAGLLIAAACTSTSYGYHWPRRSGTQTLVYVEATSSRVGADLWGPLLASVDHWTRGAKHVAIRVVADCPTSNCIRFVRGGVDYASGGVAVDESRHIVDGIIQFKTGTFGSDAYNATCHELGHALGLGHSPNGVPGPCLNGWPTAWDLALIDRDYNHLDATGPAGV